MSERDERYDDVDTSHLDDVEDGCGCTEMWEHTSEDRETRPKGASPNERAGSGSDDERSESPGEASGESPEPATREIREADAGEADDDEEAIPEQSN